jgi:hypothetical protein
MLHITNGDTTVAVMKRARLPGEMLPWRDVLHEGPTPAGLTLLEMAEVRARFVAESGWAPFDKALAEFRARDAQLFAFGRHEEVVLWFEHDLYDQLQLLQLLDWFAEQDLGTTRLSLMCIDEYFGTMGTERLAGLYPRRRPVTTEQLELAKTAWSAFCSPEPLEWQALIDLDTFALPYLGAAVVRHLEQYPSVENGTNRTEHTLLNIVNSGVNTPVKIFDAVQTLEESRFMGDSVFWNYLHTMTQSHPPLLEVADAGTFELPDACSNWDEFRSQTLTLTDSGEDVLACRADWVAINGGHKWLGGVHLTPDELWRWDADAHALVRSDR